MIPNRIKKGDTIGIIAPSNPIREQDLEEINKSILLIEASGYKIQFAKNALSNSTGYGGTPIEKAEDINEMFKNSNIKMIWIARGGENSNSTFDYLDYDIIQKNPKIICGYSDSVSLLNVINLKTGLVTYMGETFKSLTSWETDYSYRQIINKLELGKTNLFEEDDKCNVIIGGKAEGRLIGGNLSLTTLFAAGKYKADFKNKILVMEDLGFESSPEAITRYLYILKQNGIFEDISGIWVGNYEHESKISLENIVLDVVGKEFNKPIIKSNNFGHTDRKMVIPIGTMARIDTKEDEKIKLIEDFIN